MAAVAPDTGHPVGFITEVHGPVVVVACDRLPPLRNPTHPGAARERIDLGTYQARRSGSGQPMPGGWLERRG